MCWNLQIHLRLVVGNNFGLEYLDNMTQKRPSWDFAGMKAEADCSRSFCIARW